MKRLLASCAALALAAATSAPEPLLMGYLGGSGTDDCDGKAGVEAVAVGFGIHCDRANAQIFAGADDAQGDLAAVGDQNLLEHFLNLGLAGADGEERFAVFYGASVFDQLVDQ